MAGTDACDYIAIQAKVSVCSAKTQGLLIRTVIGDPLNVATTDDGGPINVTTGKVDEVNKLTELDEDNTTIDINGTTIGTVTTASTCTTIGSTGITAIWDKDISAYTGAKAGTYLDTVYDKLPTNYIMGSSVLTAKDDEIDLILTDTAAMDTGAELRALVAEASVDATGNTGVFVISLNAEAISTNNQYVGMKLLCGANIRQIVATSTGTPDTITVEPGNPFATAPTNNPCYVVK